MNIYKRMDQGLLTMKLSGLALTLIPTTAQNSFAAHTLPEKYYQEKWCSERKGQAEVVLPDQTRADRVTSTHAIEFDFGKKWAESLGQALYYSLQTGKRAGIVLILEEAQDRKYWIRLNSTIEHFHLPINAWEMGNR